MQCKFCSLHKQEEKILFETDHFIAVESKFPIIPGHCLLISKQHVQTEVEILNLFPEEYNESTIRIYNYMIDIYKMEAFVFINSQNQQSIPHFHKHFLPGVFGVLGIEKALKTYVGTAPRTRGDLAISKLRVL